MATKLAARLVKGQIELSLMSGAVSDTVEGFMEANAPLKKVARIEDREPVWVMPATEKNVMRLFLVAAGIAIKIEPILVGAYKQIIRCVNVPICME